MTTDNATWSIFRMISYLFFCGFGIIEFHISIVDGRWWLDSDNAYVDFDNADVDFQILDPKNKNICSQLISDFKGFV